MRWVKGVQKLEYTFFQSKSVKKKRDYWRHFPPSQFSIQIFLFKDSNSLKSKISPYFSLAISLRFHLFSIPLIWVAGFCK